MLFEEFDRQLLFEEFDQRTSKRSSVVAWTIAVEADLFGVGSEHHCAFADFAGVFAGMPSVAADFCYVVAARMRADFHCVFFAAVVAAGAVPFARVVLGVSATGVVLFR